MQYGDAVCGECQRQGFGIGRQFLGGDPKRGANQVTDPDFFERHVERYRKPLIDAIVAGDAQHGVFTAQEMADSALRDGDAFRLAG